MKSFRVAYGNAVPAGPSSVSVSDLAQTYGLTPPFNLLTLMNRLKPETMGRESGKLGPSTTTGSAQLFMNSAGFWFFRGDVREDGLIGHHYVFAVAINGFLHPSGKAIVFAREGEVDGGADWRANSSRDSHFEASGREQFIEDNWDIIKNTRAEFKLHVSTDATEAFAAVMEMHIIVVVAVGAVLLMAPRGSKSTTRCELVPVADAQGGGGLELRCVTEYD